MTSISAITAWKAFKEKKINFVESVDIARLFDINNANTAYKLLQRLEKKNVLKRVVGGIYLISDAQVSEFEIANACLTPSYVSLESALSYYGILSQFPYSITSVTVKRGKNFHFNKEFEYAHIDPSFFWGFVKDKNFLIATPEKAVLDMLYFSSKGLKKTDFDELDLSLINKEIMKDYSRKVGEGLRKKLSKLNLI